MGKSYKEFKERTRQEAKDWQNDVNEKNLSWWDVSHCAEHFEKLARRYGLTREFRENGII